MVLRAFGRAGYDLPGLRAAVGTRSIWTIDLAHLLASCGCPPTLLTVTLGANPSYATERFYAAEMEADAVRVAGLFQVRGRAWAAGSVERAGRSNIRNELDFGLV